MVVLQFLDVVVVVIGVIVAVLLGAPTLGCAIGGGGWLLQRLVRAVDRRYTSRLRDPRRQVGIHVTESFGRIWLLAGAIIAAAVIGDRKDGLAAAITVFATYSVAFAIRLMSGPPPERDLNQQ